VRAQVRLTQGAEDDLLGIYRLRLAERGPGGNDRADALLDHITSKLEALTDHPERGPVPPELQALGIRTYRQISIPPFRAIYWPELEASPPMVTIMLIADTRRDFRMLLEERVLRPSV
jgi:toxin ParE1/3/4